VTVPTFDQPIVGNDTITAHDLLSGSKVRAFDHSTAIGSVYSNSTTNWMNVSPNIPTSPRPSSVSSRFCAAPARFRRCNPQYRGFRRRGWWRRSARERPR
jgi:hypothetical protein